MPFYEQDVIEHFATILDDNDDDKGEQAQEPVKNHDGEEFQRVTHGVRLGLELLQSGNTVPFICRYRVDMVSPLTVKQVHKLSEILSKYDALSSVRQKSLKAVSTHNLYKKTEKKKVCKKIRLSICRSEIDELYAPFKPPPKGSLAERAAKVIPSESVDNLWADIGDQAKSIEILNFVQRIKGKVNGMTSRNALIHLLALKIANSPDIHDTVKNIGKRSLVVHTKKKSKSVKKANSESNKLGKYEAYYDKQSRIQSLRDYQVLAIRRGVESGELSLSLHFNDPKYIKKRITHILFSEIIGKEVNVIKGIKRFLHDAVEDAFSRLIVRRITSSVWREKLSKAQQRGIDVFACNVREALLAPPLLEPTRILAVDPGYSAGMKIAMLSPCGNLLFDTDDALMTIRYIQKKAEALKEFSKALRKMAGNESSPVTVALGNGHGSEDCRLFIEEASSFCGIKVKIMLINEAGASVWSVTDAAMKEFPSNLPAEIASVSIGRRALDPLNEIVKIPPKNLGLGMWKRCLLQFLVMTNNLFILRYVSARS